MKSQIFIAAGGRGERLGNITINTPKSMALLHGRPIINHIIDSARNAGIKQIVVGLDNGKESFKKYLYDSGVEVEMDCVEPLTKVFLRSVKERSPDIIIGVNGDTIYYPESILRIIKVLNANSNAAAALLLTKVVRPVLTSSWIYWRHHIENGVLTAMDEVAGHKIATEYIMAIFKTAALKELSNNFTDDFYNHTLLPFSCYSLGWDYLLKLLLWRKFKVIGLINDDLSLNVNCPRDLVEGEYLFSNPGFFRWIRMIPNGFIEPIHKEKSLILIKPTAVKLNLISVIKSELDKFGLKIINEAIHQFDEQMAISWYQKHQNKPWFNEAVNLLTSGNSISFIVESKGAFYKALCWKKAIRKRFAITPTDNLVHSTFSRCSFEVELQREMSILGLK